MTAEDKGSMAYDEIYEGRNSRSSILVRMESVERVAKLLTYVCTSVMIASICGFGAMVFKVLVK